MSRQRGILGLQKDPKRQMLFMFRVPVGEEWPSSDSEDSDYAPDRKTGTDSDVSADSAEDSRPSKRKREPRRPVRNKRQKIKPTQPDSSDGGGSGGSGGGGSSSRAEGGRASGSGTTPSTVTAVPELPPELWLIVFKHHVELYGPLPFLCRASRVCHMWHDLAVNPSLWRSVDLSYGWIKSTDHVLCWLARHRLSLCRSINLSGWKNLTNEALKDFSERCPHLQVVNLSCCKKLTSAAVTALVSSCPQLQQLDLSLTSADAVSPQSLTRVASTAGASLTSLVVARNPLRGTNLILNSIMDCCPNLSTLDFSNCLFSTEYLILNIEKLQASCPLLRILRLANCKVRGNQVSQRVQAEAKGFVELRQLSCAVVANANARQETRREGVPDNVLARLLHKAEKLELLDLRGCTNFHPDTLLLVAPLSVQQLYLSQSSFGRSGHTLAALFMMWRHSLREIDLAWMSPASEHLHTAIDKLTGLPTCPVTSLNLAGTSVTLPAVRLALDKLKQLQRLDLTSCRSLPRGIKCLHDGPVALRKLATSLKSLGDDSDSDTDSY